MLLTPVGQRALRELLTETSSLVFAGPESLMVLRLNCERAPPSLARKVPKAAVAGGGGGADGAAGAGATLAGAMSSKKAKKPIHRMARAAALRVPLLPCDGALTTVSTAVFAGTQVRYVIHHGETMWFARDLVDTLGVQGFAALYEGFDHSCKASFTLVDAAAGGVSMELLPLFTSLGVFRIVLRNPSATATKFHEFTTQIERQARSGTVEKSSKQLGSKQQRRKHYGALGILARREFLGEALDVAQWVAQPCHPDVQTWKQPVVGGRAFVSIKAVCEMPAAPGHIFELLWNLERRQGWDTHAKDMQLVEDISTDSSIVSYQMHTPELDVVQPRDVCLLQTFKIEDSGAFTIAMRSTSHAHCPLQDFAVRADVVCSGWVLAPAQTAKRTTVTHVTIIDFKESPKLLYEHLLRTIMQLRDAADEGAT